MALLTCDDCGGNVSDKAAACPACGRPIKAAKKAAPAKQNPGCASIVAGVLLCLLILGLVLGSGDDDSGKSNSGGKTAAAAETKQAEPTDSECQADLQCWSDRFQFEAQAACKPAIERQALHDLKWNDGFLDPMFSRIAWDDEKHTVVRYIGDKVMFQNGFGAMTPMSYACSYDTAHKTLLGAEVFEGRLPE